MPIQELNQKDLERAKARNESGRIEEQEKYRFYKPNGRVADFIKVVGSNKHFVNLFVAANGVGKTSGLANILAGICFGDSGNQYLQYPLFQQFPYIKRGRIISDPTTISQAIIPELKKWFPSSRYTTSKGGKSYEYNWKTDTGFRFDILTTEQENKEFESVNLGFCLIDEPCPRSIVKATIARMRRGGILILAFTPLTGSSFFYDEFVVHPDTIHY